MAARHWSRPQVAAVSIAIPSLDLSGPLDELGVADDGELLAPDDPSRAGWYAGGVVPGDLGPAIVGGHVDSRRGRGRVLRAAVAAPGDVVEITRSDGRVARFSVSRVQQVAKDRFPTAAVYGPTPRPELRLITCGGRFDRTVRSYTDNVVVEAVAAVTTVRNTGPNGAEYCVRSAGLPSLDPPRQSAQRHQRGPRHALPPFCAADPDRAGISIPGRPALSSPEERSPR